MTLIDEIQHDMEQHPLDRNPAVMARALEEIQKLRAELDALKRNNAYCPMCGSGTVPSVPDDTALLRQALEVLDPCDGLRCFGMGKARAATIDALRERLK